MKLQIELQAEDTSTAAQQFDIPLNGGTVVLGRGPESPVPLEGSKLSRNHLAFGVVNGALTVTDLSSNGVWVNAQSVPKKSPVNLSGSEEISIPGYRMRVKLLLPPPEPAPPPAAPAPVPNEKRAPAQSAPQPVAEEKRRITAEHSNATNTPVAEAPAPDGPPWWSFSKSERMIGFFIALAIGLIAYYYALL